MDLARIAPELSGLAPSAWLCVRDGYSREEVKDELLRQVSALAGPAVCTLEALATAVVGTRSEKILRPDARREVLRTLLRVRAISGRLPEINRKSQSGRRSRFVARLDRAIAQGRLCYAHQDEWLAQEEHLRLVRGARPLRAEIRALALAYEAWLESEGYWDLPRLLIAAAEQLRESGAPEGFPARVFRLGVSKPEPREAFFWDALAQACEVIDVEPETSDGVAPQTYEIWHSVDDAAHAAAEGWKREPSGVLLIPDAPEVRRSLRLALAGQDAGLRDPRDPMASVSSEKLKLGLLPLRVAAFSYARRDVHEYLSHAARRGRVSTREFEAWAFEMADSGWVSGLEGTRRARFPEIERILNELEQAFGARRTLAEIAAAHLAELRAMGMSEVPFDRHWSRAGENLALVGESERRMRAREAWERLQLLVEESPPESDGFYEASGAEVFRAQVPPPLDARGLGEPLTILGLGASWLDEGGAGDLWYSEADRDALSEFGLAGREELRSRRLSGLRAWVARASRVRWVDFQYAASGSERERADRLWHEVGRESDAASPIERGAHPRWEGSLAGPRLLPRRDIVLAPKFSIAGNGRPLLTATQLENASRCGAISLVRDRWRLRDLEEAGPEIQAASRGTLLHEAVRRLLRARAEDGTITLSSIEALDQAIAEVRLRGLMRGERVMRVARARLLPILDAFLVEESKYFTRAGATPISLDERELKYAAARADVIGKPDRIDQATEGLFIMDYKSSAANPSGTEMLEHGYRLQLPLYALAAEQQLKQPVLGVQFIPLARGPRRSAGVFFDDINGKEKGKLVQTTKANRSWLQGRDRAEVWSEFTAHVDRAVARMLAGEYSARPMRGVKECLRCQYLDLCGQHRDASMGRASDTDEAAEEGVE